ncbi:hypothetical protein E2542_SST01217 [Spatholobus suberectus]|nr:hypothetical protein E2542_SST01217 [Spatholobus suberectus]
MALYFAETWNDENLAQASVKEIVRKCLGYEVEQKSEIGVSDWDRKFLSDDQVAYATADAYCAFLVGRNSRVGRFGNSTGSLSHRPLWSIEAHGGDDNEVEVAVGLAEACDEGVLADAVRDADDDDEGVGLGERGLELTGEPREAKGTKEV